MATRILIIAAFFTAVTLSFGLWQIYLFPFKPAALVVCVATFVPVALAVLLALGMRSRTLFVACIVSSLSLCLMYLVVAVDAFLQTGLLYPPAVFYPGALFVGTGAISTLIAWQGPNNSFKSKPLRGST